MLCALQSENVNLHCREHVTYITTRSSFNWSSVKQSLQAIAGCRHDANVTRSHEEEKGDWQCYLMW